jgi:CheY-like chemotaxis protein
LNCLNTRTVAYVQPGAEILLREDLFRQRFRRETRQGTYVLHFAASGEEALDRLAGEIEPQLIVILSDRNMPGTDGLELLRVVKERRPELHGSELRLTAHRG